ncbi:hypothetical protein WL78_24005 [Burkholderia ubonensis]|nr:hypothetical protein WJ84_00375 [Burkholderia ubonensis]KWE64937.1 hypothetical protein WL78_24005 [Burkholderia ubonensis]
MHFDGVRFVGRHVIANVASSYLVTLVHLRDMSQDRRPPAVRQTVTVQRGADVSANIVLIMAATLLISRLGK